MRVLRDQYIQECERGRGRKEEREKVSADCLPGEGGGESSSPASLSTGASWQTVWYRNVSTTVPTTRTKHANYTPTLPTETVTPAVIKRRRKLMGGRFRKQWAHIFLLPNWQCSQINNAGLNNLHQLKRVVYDEKHYSQKQSTVCLLF